MRFDQHAAGFFHMADHPCRGVDGVDFPAEQSSRHLRSDRDPVRHPLTDGRSLPHVDTMPDVTSLSETELADRSGTTPGQIRRLAEVGILVPDGDGAFRLADVQRVRLAEACERGGITLDDMGKAMISSWVIQIPLVAAGAAGAKLARPRAIRAKRQAMADAGMIELPMKPRG